MPCGGRCRRWAHAIAGFVELGAAATVVVASLFVGACSATAAPHADASEPPTDGPAAVLGSSAPPPLAAPRVASSADAPPPSEPEATGPPTTEALAVDGFLPAVLVVPAGAAPRPLVVVLHGAGGRPEPHCARYAEITRGRAFVLCTRGRPLNRLVPEEERGYFYDGHHELGREVLAALAALAATHGDRVDRSDAMFAGYSQGASMGLLFLHEKAEHAALFSSVLLVEGGFADWNVALSARMVRAGVHRVALVCGQVRCHEEGERSLGWMKRGGLDARLSYAPRAGHTYDGSVRPRVDEAFAWLVEQDGRFAEHETDAFSRNFPPSNQ